MPPDATPSPRAARAALAAAFDGALRQVDRALAAGLRTAGGEDAAPHLAQLREGIVAERDATLERGRVETGWVRATVRDVAVWTPETEVALLAALGGIARAGGRAYGEDVGDEGAIVDDDAMDRDAPER
jgi:hypothetical protein